MGLGVSPESSNLMCVPGHMTLSLCIFPEGPNSDHKLQRVLWAECAACAKALR